MAGRRRQGPVGVYLAYQAASGFGCDLFAAPFALFLIQRVGLSPFELVLTGTVLEIAITLGESSASDATPPFPSIHPRQRW